MGDKKENEQLIASLTASLDETKKDNDKLVKAQDKLQEQVKAHDLELKRAHEQKAKDDAELARLRLAVEKKGETPALNTKQDKNWIDALRAQTQQEVDMQESDNIDAVVRKFMKDAEDKARQKPPVVFTLEDKIVRHNPRAWLKFLFEGGVAVRRELERDLRSDFALLSLTSPCQILEDLCSFIKEAEKHITAAREASATPKQCLERAYSSLKRAEEKMAVLEERMEERAKKAKHDSTPSATPPAVRGKLNGGGAGHRPRYNPPVHHHGYQVPMYAPPPYYPHYQPSYRPPYQPHSYGGQFQPRGRGGRGGGGGRGGRPY